MIFTSVRAHTARPIHTYKANYKWVHILI